MAKRSKGGLQSIPADPDVFEEAVGAWRRRVPVTEQEWIRLNEAERKYAFKAAAVSQARQAQDIFDAIDRAVRDGTTVEEFKADMAEVLPQMADYRIEGMFRTNVMSAYNQGRHAIFTTPVVKKLRPYWRFDGVADARQSDICEECDGTVLPADDPFWKTHTPPLHYACRSHLTALTPEEAEEEGIDEEPPETDDKPAEGFGAPPPKVGRDFSVDLESFRPEIRVLLEKRIHGGQ